MFGQDNKGLTFDATEIFSVLTAPSAHPLIAAYFEHRDAMGRFLRARLGAGGDSDDLLQELYLKVATLDPETEVRDPRAYLYRLASNLVMDRHRSGRRAAVRDSAWRLANHATMASEDIADSPSAEAVVEGRERLATLVSALSALPPKTQSIFRMHKFEGHSYADVAANLGISRSSVEKHMMDALKFLSARVRA